MRGFINGLTIAWGIAFLSLFKYKHDSTYSISCEESGSETPYLILLVATGIAINKLLQKSQESIYVGRKVLVMNDGVESKDSNVSTLSRLNTPD